MDKLLLPALVIGGGLLIATRAKAKPTEKTTRPEPEPVPEVSPFEAGSHCTLLAGEGVVAQWSEERFRPAALIVIGTMPLPRPPAEPPDGADDDVYENYESAYAKYQDRVQKTLLKLTDRALKNSLSDACYDANTDAYAEVYKAAWLSILVEFVSRGQVDEEISDLLNIATTPGFDPRDPATYPEEEPLEGETPETGPPPLPPPLPPIPPPDPVQAFNAVAFNPPPPQEPEPPAEPPTPELPPAVTWPPTNAEALHTRAELDYVRLVDLVEAIPEVMAPKVPVSRMVLFAYEPSWEHSEEMLQSMYEIAEANPDVSFVQVSLDDVRTAYGKPAPHEFVRFFVTAVSDDGYGWQSPISGVGHAILPIPLLLWDNVVEYATKPHVGQAFAAVAGVGRRGAPRSQAQGAGMSAAFRRVLTAERIRAINTIARVRDSGAGLRRGSTPGRGKVRRRRPRRRRRGMAA